MTDKPLIPPDFLPRALLRHPGIWQLDTHPPDRFATLCKNLGSRLVIWASDVVQLWQAGLLRADLVVASERRDDPGLVFVDQREETDFCYADHRVPALTERGVRPTC